MTKQEEHECGSTPWLRFKKPRFDALVEAARLAGVSAEVIEQARSMKAEALRAACYVLIEAIQTKTKE